MEERPKSLADYVRELNSRIYQNHPTQRMRIIQEFYRERVEAGEKEIADSILTIRAMIIDASSDSRESSSIINQGTIIMGDQYKTGQAGAVGPEAHAHDMTFNQIWNELSSKIDTQQLAKELTQLREALADEASKTDQYVALAEVAQAEEAAIANDGPKALHHLKKAGSWVLNVATQIGAGLAVEVLKKVSGM